MTCGYNRQIQHPSKEVQPHEEGLIKEVLEGWKMLVLLHLLFDINDYRLLLNINPGGTGIITALELA